MTREGEVGMGWAGQAKDQNWAEAETAETRPPVQTFTLWHCDGPNL